MNDSTPVATLAPRLSSALGAFIDARYLTSESLQEIRERFVAEPRQALMLPGFLAPGFLQVCERGLASFGLWRRKFTVITGATTSAEVTEQAWRAAPATQRFSAGEYAAMDEVVKQPPAELVPLVRFALTGSVLKTWLALCFDVPVRINSCELVRYRPGDFLAPHTDRIDGRLFGCNLYFDPNLLADSGGKLGFRPMGGPWAHLVPTSGALSLIPITLEHEHEVEPWQEGRVGRQTLAMSFRREADTCPGEVQTLVAPVEST